jgi:hypothetical protein
MVFVGVSLCVLRVWSDVCGWPPNVPAFFVGMIGDVRGVFYDV